MSLVTEPVTLTRKPTAAEKMRASRERGAARRAAAAELVIRTRAELTAALGHPPDAFEADLIERATMLKAHLAELDRRMIGSSEMTTLHASRLYLSWTTAQRRCLADLRRLAEPAPAASTLANVLARHALTPSAGEAEAAE